MLIDELNITTGDNDFQTALFEKNDKTIEYETSRQLSYSDIKSITKGLDLISEFYDVPGAVTTTPSGICAASLGKSISDAVTNVMDSNPIDFMQSTIVLSGEADSDIAKMLKETHIVAAPSFTKNAAEYFNTHNVCFVTIKTPLKEYKKYMSNEVIVTPLGTITQSPNISELKKESFKIVTKTKPTKEQTEDAIFAWKVAKHVQSRAIVIAKDFKTVAVSKGLQSSSVEFAVDYACDSSKEAVLASDSEFSLHDLNVAAQGRISLLILPFTSKELIEAADKFNISIITTGFTNILY